MIVLLRATLKLAITLVLLFTSLLIALFFILHSAKFKDWLQNELSQQSGFEIRLASLQFQLPFSIVAETVEASKTDELLFSASRLTATVTPFDALSKTLHRIEIEKPVLRLDIDQMMQASRKTSAKIALRHLTVQDGTIVLTNSQATVFELPKINLTAENLNLGEQSGIHLRADVPPLNGEAELRITGQPRNLDTEIIIRPKRSQSLIAPQVSNAAGSELARLRATLHAPDNQNGSVTVESKIHDLTLGDAKITGNLDAQMEIDASWKVASFSGRATLTDFPKAIYPAAEHFPNGKATASFAGVFELGSKTLSLRSVELSSPLGAGAGKAELRFEPRPRITKANLTLREIPLDKFKPLFPAPLDQWIYQGRGELELYFHGALDALDAKGIIRGDPLQIRSDNIQMSNLALTAPFEWIKPALRIKEAKLNATKLAYGANDRWQASAERMQASASFDFKADEPLKISGELATTGGKFSSPDGSKVGENLTVGGSFEITARPADKSTSLSGKFRAKSGDLLLGKFFGDLKTQLPLIEFSADYVRDNDRLDCHPCKLNLLKIGSVDISGSIERLTDSPEFRLEARSTNLLPGGFFEFALRETFKRQYPVLDKLAVEGQMIFQVQLDGTLDVLGINGELSLKTGELRAKANDWRIGPIALDLPFQIRLPESKRQPAGNLRRGMLSIETASFGKQLLGPISTTVSLWNNALQFYQPIRATLFGGEIGVANLFWPDVVSDPKRLSFSVEAKRLELEQLTEAMKWHPFAGTLTCSIPEVQSAGNLLRTSGEIQAEVFGGRASISKLEIENPFSSLASIKLDARLNDIQLEQLSRTFEFGRISGILEGSIDDLVITDNQPSQFRADLQSVDRGAEQRISVEALNKITVLSSGENAGALYGGLAGFFDSFRYSRLGFKAILKNDRLTLRGAESRGDQEFLVVGSLLAPTVNIISHTQTIAFSELMRRLERIKSDKSDVK